MRTKLLFVMALVAGTCLANIAVKWAGANHPQGIPEQWPILTQDVGEQTEPPAGFDDVMTPSEYAAHRASLQAAYDAAMASNKTAQAQAAVIAQAKGKYSDSDRDSVVIRALALVILDEINTLRAQHGLQARTAQQLKNAVEAKIDTLP